MIAEGVVRTHSRGLIIFFVGQETHELFVVIISVVRCNEDAFGLSETP